MGDNFQEQGRICKSNFTFWLYLFGLLGLLPASLWPGSFASGCLGRHQRPSQLCCRHRFFRAPQGLAVPPKRKGAKCACHAWWGTLHGPDLSWCSFIFSNRADGGCRGEEKDSTVCQRSLRPSANVNKLITRPSELFIDHWWCSRTWLHLGSYFKILHSVSSCPWVQPHVTKAKLIFNSWFILLSLPYLVQGEWMKHCFFSYLPVNVFI